MARLCDLRSSSCFFKEDMATGFRYFASNLERLLEEAAKDVTPREKDKVLSILFF